MPEVIDAPVTEVTETPVVPAEIVPDGQNPAEQAPVDKPAEPAVKTEESPEKHGTRRFERRLDRAYRRAAEAEARAQLYERQLSELKPQATQTPGTPRIEDFSDIQEYAKAYAKHETERTLKEHAEKQQQQQSQATQQQLVSQWEARASKAEAKYEDFDEVVGDIKPTTPWAVAIMRAENGEDIAYHLGKNMAETHRIHNLDPFSQILEIGRLGAKLSLEPPKPKTASKAPAPIAPLGGTSGAASEAPSDQDDMKTWMRKRQKQVHGK